MEKDSGARGEKRKIGELEIDQASRELYLIFRDQTWMDSGRERCNRVVELVEAFPALANREYVLPEFNGTPIFHLMVSPSANKCYDTFEKVYELSDKETLSRYLFAWAFQGEADIRILQKLAHDLPSEQIFDYVRHGRTRGNMEIGNIFFDSNNPLAQLDPSNADDPTYQTSMDRLKVLLNVISANQGDSGAAYVSKRLVYHAFEYNTTLEALELVAKQYHSIFQTISTNFENFDICRPSIIDTPQVEMISKYIMPCATMISDCECKWTMEGYTQFLQALVSNEDSRVDQLCEFPLPSPTNHPQLYASLNNFLEKSNRRWLKLIRADIETFVEATGDINPVVNSAFETTIIQVDVRYDGGFRHADIISERPQLLHQTLASLPCVTSVHFNCRRVPYDWTETLVSILDHRPNIARLRFDNDSEVQLDWKVFLAALSRNTSLKSMCVKYLDIIQQKALLKVLNDSNRTLLNIPRDSFPGTLEDPELYEQIQYRLLLNDNWNDVERSGDPNLSMSEFLELVEMNIGYFDAFLDTLPAKTKHDKLNLLFTILRESHTVWSQE